MTVRARQEARGFGPRGPLTGPAGGRALGDTPGLRTRAVCAAGVVATPPVFVLPGVPSRAPIHLPLRLLEPQPGGMLDVAKSSGSWGLGADAQCLLALDGPQSRLRKDGVLQTLHVPLSD